MDPRSPPAVFFKVSGVALDDLLPGEAPARASEESRWAAVVAGMACLGPLHDPSQRLGVALARAELSEFRFARLIRADAERLIDEILALARFFAAKGIQADWSAAANLMLSAGRADEEPVRRHIARDYYGTLARDDRS
jgi:CRISPR type I-E-associated protein CasB/Cse2